MRSHVTHDNNEILDRYGDALPALGRPELPGGLNRREFTRRACTVAGAMSMSGVFQTLAARSAKGSPVGDRFGPLTVKPDMNTGLGLIALPDGFEYTTFSWTRDPLRGRGQSVPGLHDGMAAFVVGDNYVILIRNHELSGGTAFRAPTFDPGAGGGTTNVLFNAATFSEERTWGSLSGTIRNCAGGPTPWKSWLTCEETGAAGHGWVFDVPAIGFNAPVPLMDMGRFSHEAVAVAPLETDPRGIVYETEDSGTAGFYRFIPNDATGLRTGGLRGGGTLQMLGIAGNPMADLSSGVPVGVPMDATWFTIDDPTAATTRTFTQGFDQGAARFTRLEGAWFGVNDAGAPVVYFDATNGGDAGEGQIFEYNIGEETLTLLYESPDADVLDSPDNLTVVPGSGDILICEDGGRDKQLLHVLTQRGQICPFAENNVVLNGEKNGFSGDFTGREWAGATFAVMPDGQMILFVNIQTPGITFAIRGPFFG